MSPRRLRALPSVCFLAMLGGCGATAVRDDAATHRDGAGTSALTIRLLHLSQDAEALSRREDVGALAQQDHRTRARLLRAAAESEQQRAASISERAHLAAEVAELAATVQAERHRRSARLRELALAESAKLALAASTEAFQQAAELEDRNGRAGGPSRHALRSQAAETLRTRAQLLLAAGQAIGASADSVAEVQQFLERSREAHDDAGAVVAAEQAVRAAYRALATGRLPEGTDDAQRNALVEALMDAGVAVERRDEGLVVVVEDVFSPTGAAPAGRGRAALLRVASVLAGLSRGPLQVIVSSGGSDRRGSPRAEQRKASILALLAGAGLPPDRLHGTADAREGHGVTLVVLSMGVRPEMVL